VATLSAPSEGILLTHFIVSRNVEKARDFYVDVLGGEVVRHGQPTIVSLANAWITINIGAGPTEDKRTITLEAPPDPDRVTSFLNIRVADIDAVYRDWTSRGADVLTPPIDRGVEIRCYMRDPDGHLIEVGQLVRGTADPILLADERAQDSFRLVPAARCRAIVSITGGQHGRDGNYSDRLPASVECPCERARGRRTRRVDDGVLD
jgi:catechol 2,3-dioxygenase-like lactoylglutathione lyase family enzyme